MGPQFTAKIFLLKAPNELLQRYFDKHAPGFPVKWEDLEDRDIEPILDAWNDLPREQAQKIENEFRTIYELASEPGLQIIVDEADIQKLDIVDTLMEKKGLCHMVFWVYMDHPKLFEIARTFDMADRLDGRSWRKRKDIPKKEPDVSMDAQKLLGNSLAAYFRQKQGRGRVCEIKYYLRMGKDHYFFAYPEDYAIDFIGYSSDGRLEKRILSPAFEVLFVYHPSEGALSLFARGKKDFKQDLEEIFCRCILKEDLGPETKKSQAYELNVLKNKNVTFPTEPADRLQKVMVKRLRLTVMGRPEHRVILEVDTRKNGGGIYELMDEALDHQKLPLTLVNVTQASLQAVLSESNNKTKTVNFNVTHPDRCTLKDKPEELLVKKYLVPWGLERA